mgnify:CR=1 FL=1|jgi:hypothetical protein
MPDYEIELEIVEGNGGELRSDGTRPDFAQEGICAWMYGPLKSAKSFATPTTWVSYAPGWSTA